MDRMQAHLISGGRLHLQDGPIDLIIGAMGPASERECAYRTASRRFSTILDELCEELDLLRMPVEEGGPRLRGTVAKRMAEAVEPYRPDAFITPMASVAGAVAEEVLGTMVNAARLERAYVNNGGDIALHLGDGEVFSIGLVSRPDQPSLFGETTLWARDGVFGIATSGWRGRSFSLGIADAVTVLAADAAKADAAATIIANAVDLPGHPSVVRARARDIQPDSDLGDLLVTRSVGPLTANETALALDCGVAKAWELIERRLIVSAALHLDGTTRVACHSCMQKRLFPVWHAAAPAVPALAL